MKIILLLVVCLISGCSFIQQNQFNEILGKHPSQWTENDCKEIITGFMVHNMYSLDANVRVHVTPCYPIIITATNRLEQIKQGWSNNQFRLHVGQQARDILGMSVDWQTMEYIDAKGVKYQSVLQLDSLLFLITIANKNYPTSIPSITDLEEQIFLENNLGQLIKPIYVRGKQQNQLIKEETVNAMFRLREDVVHFLDGAQTMYIVIHGFGEEVRLPFPLSISEQRY
jgi:hypothetical protein